MATWTPDPGTRSRPAGWLALCAAAALAAGCPAPYEDDDTAGDDDTQADDDTYVDGCIELNGVASFRYVQDAVDAAVDGDVVSLCAGLFLESVSINKAITLTSHSAAPPTIRGVGGAPAVRVVGVQGARVEKIVVEADDVAIHVSDSGAATLSAIQVESGTPWAVRVTGSDVVVEDSVFTANAAGGIDAEDGSTLSVLRTAIRAGGGHGIRATGSAIAVEDVEFAGIADPDLTDAVESGIAISAEALTTLTVLGGSFSDGGSGIQATGGTVDVRLATFTRLDRGILHTGASEGTLANGNTFESVRGIAVEFGGAGTVDGNTFTFPDESDTAQGVVVTQATGTVRVAGNVMDGLGGGGIRISTQTAGATVQLQDNTATDCGDHGISVSGADVLSLSGDVVQGIGWDVPVEEAGVGVHLDGVASATLSGVSVGLTDGFGVRIEGGATLASGLSIVGAGLGAISASGGASVTLEAAVLEGSRGRGIRASGGSLVLMEGGSISETESRVDPVDGTTSLPGAAIEAVGTSTSVSATGTAFSANGAGILAEDASVSLDSATLSATHGSVVDATVTGAAVPTLEVRDSVVAGGDAGITATGYSVTLAGVTVTGAGTDAVTVQGGSGSTLSDVDVADGGGRAVLIGETSGVSIDGLEISGCPGAGLVIASSVGVTAADVRIVGAVDTGVLVQASESVSFEGLDVQDTAGDGVSASQVTGLSLAGASVRGSTGDGIDASYTTLAVSLGSEALGNLGNGLRVVGGSATLDGLDASQNGEDGIGAFSAVVLEATGCVVSTNGGYGLRGTDALITAAGSAFVANTSGGVNASGGTLDLAANVGVSTNGGDGIRVSGLLTGSIVDTPISSNGGYGIWCQGNTVDIDPCHNPMSTNASGDFAEIAGCDLACTVD